jgi:hypothetical protein
MPARHLRFADAGPGAQKLRVDGAVSALTPSPMGL